MIVSTMFRGLSVLAPQELGILRTEELLTVPVAVVNTIRSGARSAPFPAARLD